MSDPLPVDLIVIPPGTATIIEVEDLIPVGSALSVKSLNGDLSSGFVVVTLLS